MGGRSEFDMDENGSLALEKEILSGPFESNLTSFVLINGDSHQLISGDRLLLFLYNLIMSPHFSPIDFRRPPPLSAEINRTIRKKSTKKTREKERKKNPNPNPNPTKISLFRQKQEAKQALSGLPLCVGEEGRKMVEK